MSSNIKNFKQNNYNNTYDLSSIKLGPVVQSVVSTTSWLVEKMLTVLVSTISNSVIFAEEM